VINPYYTQNQVNECNRLLSTTALEIPRPAAYISAVKRIFSLVLVLICAVAAEAAGPAVCDPKSKEYIAVPKTVAACAKDATGGLLLPAGTAVLVRTEDDLSGDEVHEGEEVRLSTRGLVQHDREIVVPYRVVGKAFVRQVHGTGLLGAWKRFSISLEYIEAADGTRVELDHAPIPIINGPEQTPIQKKLFNSGMQRWKISRLAWGHWLLGHTKSDVRLGNPDSFPAPKQCSIATIGVYTLFKGFGHVKVNVSSKPVSASVPATGTREAPASLPNVKFGDFEWDWFEVPPGELTVSIADQKFTVGLARCAGVYYRLRSRDGRLEIETVPEEIFVIEAQFLYLRGIPANNNVGIIVPPPL
jgi:hypothetical protein